MKMLKKMLSLALIAVLILGCFAGCSKKEDEPITITVFSRLANFSGEQTGWSAKVLKDKFNVVINIIPDSDGVYETRMESGFLGDIVVWGDDGEDYTRAIEAGLLYDWNADNLLQEYGPYIYENMQAALNKNAGISESVTGKPTVYGFGHNVASSSDSYEEFLYTWDIRWDLYKQLGYPEFESMDDMIEVFKQMKEICPTDDNGNETYALTIWPDWDKDMVMYVKAFASAYYGYDELGMGLHDSVTGTFHGALEENGPYLKALKFFNDLYQNDLLDPNSMTQTSTDASEKMLAGGSFFSIFNYAGHLVYNTPENLAENKMMGSLIPSEASPIVYGMSTAGGNRVWSIGSNTEHPELCMEIINWLCTPEGTMTYHYGPKDLCWYYDEEGNTHWTEFGAAAYIDRNMQMIGDYEGLGDFNSGCLQINNTTWTLSEMNPDSNGERYSHKSWKSNMAEAGSEIEQDWRNHFGVNTNEEYLAQNKFTVAPATTFKIASKSAELKTTWSAVTDAIVTYSWRAMYAKSDAEFDAIVAQMIKEANSYGYQECLEWCVEQSNIRHQLELEVTGG